MYTTLQQKEQSATERANADKSNLRCTSGEPLRTVVAFLQLYSRASPHITHDDDSAVQQGITTHYTLHMTMIPLAPFHATAG